MFYIEHDELSIINLENQKNILTFKEIEKALQKRPANVIYCEFEGLLYGIVSMGDIDRADEDHKETVDINRNFTAISWNEIMKARQMFKDNIRINALPVIDEKGRLLGEYNRWDDLYFLNRMDILETSLDQLRLYEQYDHIILVRPRSGCKKKRYFENWETLMKLTGGEQVRIIEFAQVQQYCNESALILLIDEDEMRGARAYIRRILHKDFDSSNIVSYKNIVGRVLTKIDNDISRQIAGDIGNEVLQTFQAANVHVRVLQFKDNGSKYFQKLKRYDIPQKFAEAGLSVSGVLPPSAREGFFEELYTEEYVKHIIKGDFQVIQLDGCNQLKDISSLYLNVKDGERLTVEQPKEYDRTIYFVGPCLIMGRYVEDKHTMESFLQAKYNELGEKVRIVNLGCWNNNLGTLNRMLQIPVKKGDIIITYFSLGGLDFQESQYIRSLNLVDALEENAAPGKWFVDVLSHCNYKANKVYVDAIYEEVEPILKTIPESMGEAKNIDKNIIVSAYADVYVRRQFAHVNPKAYDNIGSIVMNCNPFTYGHRYLIEEALKTVDYLIIFVVEEDRSLFSFEERFAMIKAGTADLPNVMVVPSGQLILSQTTFPEYFVKVADEDIIQNVEYDITLFAEQIAPRLNITYRFVGEEPEDEVTREYNLAMKRILPSHGIRIIEIPRKENGKKVISASIVRNYLENGKYEELKALIPETTRKVLFPNY